MTTYLITEDERLALEALLWELPFLKHNSAALMLESLPVFSAEPVAWRVWNPEIGIATYFDINPKHIPMAFPLYTLHQATNKD